MTPTATAPAAERSAWPLAGRLTTWAPRRYFGVGFLWAARGALPLLSGLALKELFDAISGRDGGGLWYVGAFLAAEVARHGVFAIALMNWTTWWEGSHAIVQGNVMRSVLCAPGPAAGRVPHSPGEAISRLRDDTRDLVRLADTWVDLAGEVVFAVIAVALLYRVEPTATALAMLPFLVGLAVTVLLGDTVRRAHRAARAAAASVTALVGDLFGGVLAIKAGGAERAALDVLSRRNATRAEAEVRSHTLSAALSGVNQATADIAVGLVLLSVAPAMRAGEFGVGDLALFTSYLGWLSTLPRRITFVVIMSRKAAVATGRLGQFLTPDEPVGALVTHRPVHASAPAAPPPAPVAPLHLFTVTGLSARSPGSSSGVEGIDLSLRRGSFTVVTGTVGAGKTTLLRAILGLIPAESGVMRWNRAEVTDPGSFLVPPRAAYVAQVARLYSDTLAENLLLGWPDDDGRLARALHLAALEADVAAMPAGLATTVGPRGVRLSGGQLQRASTARALLRRPELLVVDDLSSALDVDTEAELWSRLARGGPATCLVVSHRRAALARADEVIVLAGGRIADRGPLPALLERSADMRRLWKEEASRLAEGELTG